jgi:putative sterol carrier protein
MTAQEVFEAIKVRAERASGIQGAFKFIVDGDKVVHIDAHQTPVQVSMEDKPADCTVRLTSDTLNDLLTGKANPATAFMFGKIKIEGNMGMAMALTKIL